jgi:hypothetical protein
MRPITSDDAAYFVVDGSDDLEAFLDLPADQFKLFRAGRATVQEFHWHAGLTRKTGRSFQNS